MGTCRGCGVSVVLAPAWYFEALIPKRGGYSAWERSTVCSSWSDARHLARELERLGYKVRTVYVEPTGEVIL